MVDKTVVDARGFSCPQPVIMTQKAINGLAHGVAEVLVDSPTAVQNVTRLAKHEGWSVTVDEAEGIYKLVLKK
jgi:tRNA 2-thiouridine synthesizing protein A